MNDFSDIRKLEYYTNKNVFSGSHGNFNYRISMAEDKLHVDTWQGKLCFELSEIASSNDFELSEEGLNQVSAWLEKENNAVG